MYKFIVLILLIGISFCKQEATTSKGKKVFLFDDGTWKYAKDVINKDDFKIQIRKIHSINHWYGMTINNECIIEFRNYLDGYYDNDDFDIEFTIHLFNEEMKKIEEYNSYINSLEGEKFNHLKYTWNKLSNELIKIQTWVNSNKSNLRYAYGRFSYHQISKYDDAFSKAYEDLRDSN